jgi:hypothetical protein
MTEVQILIFWKWFDKNSNSLQSDKYPNAHFSELDRIISGWDLSWEVGPGIKKENSFTISPNGSKSLLDKTKKIISLAHEINHWEFYFAKQPKENWHLANLVEKNLSIDATDWEYVLLKYEDEKVEILLKAKCLSELDNDTKINAADLILANLLGEELLIEKIDFMEIVETFDSTKGKAKLQYLPNHLLDI